MYLHIWIKWMLEFGNAEMDSKPFWKTVTCHVNFNLKSINIKAFVQNLCWKLLQYYQFVNKFLTWDSFKLPRFFINQVDMSLTALILNYFIIAVIIFASNFISSVFINMYLIVLKIVKAAFSLGISACVFVSANEIWNESCSRSALAGQCKCFAF